MELKKLERRVFDSFMPQKAKDEFILLNYMKSKLARSCEYKSLRKSISIWLWLDLKHFISI